MAGLRRGVAVAAICGIGAFANAGSAAAGTTEVFHSQGITYVYTPGATMSGGNQHDSVNAECEDDIPVIGGGFFSEATYGQVSMEGSIPVNINTLDPGLDGWSVRWFGSPTTTWGLKTLAICDETKPKYVEKMVKLKPETRKATKVSCPAERHVYGGGIGSESLQPGPVVQSSYPADSKADADHEPDDAWKLSADNQAITEVMVSAFAICGKADPVYEHEGVTVIPGSQGFEDTPCPENKINPIGGGQRVTGGYNDTAVAYSTAPYLATNRWEAEVDNYGTENVRSTVWAVCVGRDLRG